MGVKLNRNELLDIIAQKDGLISQLEAQVRAYAARTSHIQNRLLATFDVLDNIQYSHAAELTSETRAKERLSDKLDRYIDVVQAAEMEKDDLRDAVNQLVEKVEMSNDYSLWPHSRLRITSPVDPLVQPHLAVTDSDEQLLAYATCVITSLQAERDSERQAHQRTRQQAESQILVLEAQLARREVELETCIAHTPDCFQLAEQVVQSTTPMSQEEVAKVLSVTSAKNRALDREVKTLSERLESARLATSSQTRHRPLGPSADQGSTPLKQSTQTHILSPQFPHSHTSGPSPPLVPSHSTAPNDSPHRSPRRFSSSRESRSSQDKSPAHHGDADTIILAPIPTHPYQNIDDTSTGLDMERQIHALGAEVDAFKTERDLLAMLIAKERQTATPVTSPEIDRVLSLERECNQRRQTEQELSQRLEELYNIAAIRESELLAEIERLREAIRDWDPQQRGAPPVEALLDLDSGGEQSMDLATPLQPTLILTNPPFESPYVDPPSIPLPDSPPPQSPLSPTPLPQRVRSRLSQHEQQGAESNMQRVERELSTERRQMEERGRAVIELRNVVDDLRRRVSSSATIGGGKPFN